MERHLSYINYRSEKVKTRRMEIQAIDVKYINTAFVADVCLIMVDGTFLKTSLLKIKIFIS